MGKHYSQLRLEERVEIYRLHASGISQQKIAEAVGRSPATISRELRRNSKSTKVWKGGYDPVRAHKLAERRRRWDGRFKLMRQPDLRERVGRDLAMGHSPEQIAGRLTRENAALRISHESIYRYIYHRTAQKDYLHRNLPCHKMRRGWRGRKGGSAASHIKDRRSLDERPREVADRSTPGHWEADYMLFAKYGQNLLVLHERQTRYTLIDYLPDRTAARTVDHITERLAHLPEPLRQTISFDNGTEFAAHYQLHQSLGVQTFFCDPHSPWQKGGIENSIGRLRRQLPRKTDLAQISADTLQTYADRLNHTPRKCLDFQTPAEALSKIQSTLALQP
jgi:IS30 family transposase